MSIASDFANLSDLFGPFGLLILICTDGFNKLRIQLRRQGHPTVIINVLLSALEVVHEF